MPPGASATVRIGGGNHAASTPIEVSARTLGSSARLVTTATARTADPAAVRSTGSSAMAGGTASGYRDGALIGSPDADRRGPRSGGEHLFRLSSDHLTPTGVVREAAVSIYSACHQRSTRIVTPVRAALGWTVTSTVAVAFDGSDVGPVATM